MSPAAHDSSGWVSLANADLLLSLRVPHGWTARVDGDHGFTVLADVAASADYQPYLSITQGTPAEPGRAWFDAFAAAVPGQLADTIDGFGLIDTDEFRLSSPADGIAVQFRQLAAGAPPTSHLQAYLWCGSYRMYVLAAATSRQRERADLPVFEAILHSIRVLPKR